MNRAHSEIPWRVVVALLGASLIPAACGDAPPSPTGGVPRIVSLVPTATETLFALGAGDLVVGRSAYCDFPPEARAIPAVGDAVSVRAESVVRLGPTLVLVGSGAQAEALRPVKRAVRIENVAPRSIADVLATIRMLARESGREEAGARLVERLDAAVRTARERRRPGPPRRVVFVAQREPLVVAGGRSFLSELIECVGATNIAGDVDEEWPGLSLETLVARDPDVILDSRLGAKEGEDDPLRPWRRFSTLSAVRSGRVRVVREPSLVRAGPRLPEALVALHRLVWEDRR